MPKIMIDAGHYGKYNRSPVIKEYWESDFAWELCFLLKTALEKYGFYVGVTRSEKNKDLEVTKRGSMGEGYDLFISLHSNAEETGKADRVVIIYQVPDEPYTKVSRAYAEAVAPILNDIMECRQAHQILSVESSQDRDRDNVKDDFYGVLRGAAFAGCPAALIEFSFHTNERATRWLMNPENIKKLADVLAAATAQFFGVNIPGDVNGDGVLNAYDYALAKRIVLGTYTPTAEELRRCDINNDGKVDVFDYATIKRNVLGK